MGGIALGLLTGGWNLLKMGGSALGRFLGSLDGQGVAGLVVSLVLALTTFHQWSEARHWHKQSDRFEALYNHEVAHEASIAKQANDLKFRIDTLASSISQVTREWTDDQIASIAADSSALKLSGPGKSACHSKLPSAAGGHDQTPAKSDASGSALPPADGADVSWSWLATRAQEHDQLLAEEQAWRDWYAQLVKVWPTTAIQAKPAVPYPSGARN